MGYTHMHEFKFDTELSQQHKHVLHGLTDKVIGTNSFHFHLYHGVTSYLDHTHYFSGITSLPIKTENGHVHKLEGYVETVNNHNHRYFNYTFDDKAYIPDLQLQKAYN